MSLALVLFKRECALVLRKPGDALSALFFFVLCATLFALSINPEPQLLRALGPGALWVCALLSSLIVVGELFEGDWRDGTLEQLLLSPLPLPAMVAAKALARWLGSALPLVLVSPLLGLQFELSGSALLLLPLTLLLGTLALVFVGSIGAALTLGLRSGSMLLSLLLLPLYIPVLIFGALAVAGAQSGSGFEAELSILAALCLLSVFFAPFASAACLELACE
ncbi:heme exporter protein CcmB [Aquitalea sp. S1-19]|nr:heme exporter protein CcmB [Aquitalea sp. S1-19]